MGEGKGVWVCGWVEGCVGEGRRGGGSYAGGAGEKKEEHWVVCRRGVKRGRGKGGETTAAVCGCVDDGRGEGMVSRAASQWLCQQSHEVGCGGMVCGGREGPSATPPGTFHKAHPWISTPWLHPLPPSLPPSLPASYPAPSPPPPLTHPS